MEFTTLGRTGLRVSVAGLGCGGPSRIGQATGASESDSIALVRHAIDQGINFIDTATMYGTEPIVGRALQGIPRDAVVVSTKTHAWHQGPDAVLSGLEASLRTLELDFIDVFHLHGVTPGGYDAVREAVYPALKREQDKGKIRFIGITEMATEDPDHAMLARALDDNLWDVVMVAFHMMHQNAHRSVFPKTRANNVGTLIMFAVRRLFSVPDRLRAELGKLADAGRIPAGLAGEDEPLEFLIHDGGALNVIDAAYRYVRHHADCDVTLIGTGNPDHLAENIASVLRPPLPAADVAKLEELFGAVVGVGLDRR